MCQVVEKQETAPEVGTSRVQPTAPLVAAHEEDDDVVEVEADGAVKTEQGEEQTLEYSNDGTDVSPSPSLSFGGPFCFSTDHHNFGPV
jgi:hypothetical protein